MRYSRESNGETQELTETFKITGTTEGEAQLNLLKEDRLLFQNQPNVMHFAIQEEQNDDRSISADINEDSVDVQQVVPIKVMHQESE